MRLDPPLTVVTLVAASLLFACTAERNVVVGYIDGGAKTSTSPARPSASPARPRNGNVGPEAPIDSRGTPLLIAAPSHVQIPYATPGTLRTATLQLRNDGTGTLQLERFRLTGSKAFTVRIAGPKHWILSAGGPALEPPAPVALQPGESLPVVVEFRPQANGPADAVLRVRSNDPSREVQLAVALKGNVEVACLALDPAAQLDFGKVDVGTCRTRMVDAGNCGEVPVVVNAVGFAKPAVDSPFSVSWGAGGAAPAWVDGALNGSAGNTIVLQPGAKLPIAVTYCPAKVGDAGHDSATLGVHSSAPGPHSLPCVGVPVQPACPTAVAGVEQGDIAVVGGTMQLTAAGSKAMQGKIVQWHWQLSAPPVSGANLWPSAHVANPVIKFDVAGSYTACLDVRDSSGKKSCHPGCITLHATEEGAYGASPIW